MSGEEHDPIERREVRSADPSLSPEANRILTEELRQVLGSDVVEVPTGRPHVERELHGGRSGLVVGLASNRVTLGIAFFVAAVVGAVISLATGSWWFLPLALGVHAIGTFVVAIGALQLTTEIEHLPPSVAARLEEEGVADPDAVFSALVEAFAPPGRGARDERPTPTHEDAARATAEQRSAVTPSHDESKPVGP